MEPYLGQIQAFGFNFTPRGWAHCNGQLLPISQNQALFSLLGTIYGGDGRTTFALPDLRGRVPMNYGQGSGLSNQPIGERSGAERVTLNTNEIPAHTHATTVNVNITPGEQSVPVNNFLAKDNGGTNNYSATSTSGATLNPSAVSVQNTGGSQSHYNMQPYLAINYCIALTGLYPSRS